MTPLTPSLNGTIEDVAAFFRVSPQTVRDWSNKTEGHDQLISPTKHGRNVSYSEDAILACYLRGTKFATIEEKNAAEPGVRKLWREHLGLAQVTKEPKADHWDSDLRAELEGLRQRLDDLERIARAAPSVLTGRAA